MFDLVLAGGRVVDGTGNPGFAPTSASAATASRPSARSAGPRPRRRLDAAGKVVAPGFVDAHVHGDLALLADPLHEPAIRQGVTTYLLGQDGVAMAPASPATLDYMRRYTAGFSGRVDVPDPLVEHGGVPRPLRPPGRGERRLPGAQRQRPHGGHGPRDAAADGRRAGADAPPGPRGDGGGRGRPVERARLHPEPLRRRPRSWSSCARRSRRSAASTSRTCAATSPTASSARWTRSSASGARPACRAHLALQQPGRPRAAAPGPGRAARARRDLRPVLLPGRLHHPRHDRAAALGAGGRRRRDAGAAARPGGARAAPGRGLRRAPGRRWTTVRLSYVAAPAYRGLRGPDAAEAARRATGRTGPRPSATSCATCWSPRTWRSAASCRTSSGRRTT